MGPGWEGVLSDADTQSAREVLAMPSALLLHLHVPGHGSVRERLGPHRWARPRALCS